MFIIYYFLKFNFKVISILAIALISILLIINFIFSFHSQIKFFIQQYIFIINLYLFEFKFLIKTFFILSPVASINFIFLSIIFYYHFIFKLPQAFYSFQLIFQPIFFPIIICLLKFKPLNKTFVILSLLVSFNFFVLYLILSIFCLAHS